MKYIVYIITRDDNKKYVGTTNIDRIKKRMDAHKIDKRFVNHNFTYKVAFETDNIKEWKNKLDELKIFIQNNISTS